MCNHGKPSFLQWRFIVSLTSIPPTCHSRLLERISLFCSVGNSCSLTRLQPRNHFPQDVCPQPPSSLLPGAQTCFLCASGTFSSSIACTVLSRKCPFMSPYPAFDLKVPFFIIKKKSRNDADHSSELGFTRCVAMCWFCSKREIRSSAEQSKVGQLQCFLEYV